MSAVAVANVEFVTSTENKPCHTPSLAATHRALGMHDKTCNTRILPSHVTSAPSYVSPSYSITPRSHPHANVPSDAMTHTVAADIHHASSAQNGCSSPHIIHGRSPNLIYISLQQSIKHMACTTESHESSPSPSFQLLFDIFTNTWNTCPKVNITSCRCQFQNARPTPPAFSMISCRVRTLDQPPSQILNYNRINRSQSPSSDKPIFPSSFTFDAELPTF